MIDGIFSIRGHEFYGDDGDDESHSMLVVQCGGKESKVGLVEREVTGHVAPNDFHRK